jgi:predicted dehydrogenase
MLGYWQWYEKNNLPGMEWQCRNWPWYTWLSGDHMVEQHVHNLDVVNWAINGHPISAMGMGGRQLRTLGNIYDHFAVDFEYADGVRVTSMCRQINGCDTNVSERVIGQKGISNCNGFISTVGKIEVDSPNPYVQEHADLIQAIRTGKPVNEARQVAESTLCAIMARTSAYTGKPVTWEEIMKSDEEFGPPDYELTEENVRAHVPVPGTVQG